MPSASELFAYQKKLNDVRLVCMKYGKVKKAITQGVRAGAGKGVCSAIVNRWILSGVEPDDTDPKELRREFRQHWKPAAAMPQQFINDQQGFEQLLWMDRKNVKEGIFIGGAPI